MVPELTLVWLSATSPHTHQADIRAWSKAHQIAVRPPLAMLSTAYDPAVAEAIEVELESSRTAVAMQQGDSAALKQLCQSIVDHAELPQAAWLLAECHRLTALALMQSADALGAAERRRGANALEGGTRAEVYSESSQAMAPLAPLAVVEIETTGPRASDQIFLDGVLTGPRTLTSVGSHHVRVVRDESPLWSGWLEVAAQGGQLSVPLVVPPCSTQDLSNIAIEATRVSVPRDVRCASWVLARPQVDGTGIDVWRCRANRCTGPEQWPTAAPPSSVEQTGVAWYVWPLVGVGVALGTAAVLWQTGTFDSESEQPERPFTFTAPNAGVPAIRF